MVTSEVFPSILFEAEVEDRRTYVDPRQPVFEARKTILVSYRFSHHMKWGFPRVGVAPVIIHFERWDFPVHKNHPASWG